MTIAVDFDGTIVRHEYPRIGKEIPFAIQTLKQLMQDGHMLILNTVREGDLLNEAVEYCRQRGVEFYAVNASNPDEYGSSNRSRKVNADVFIDDHNLGGLPDWGIIYQMIKSGRPLQPYEGIEQEQTYNYKRKKGFFSRLFG